MTRSHLSRSAPRALAACSLLACASALSAWLLSACTGPPALASVAAAPSAVSTSEPAARVTVPLDPPMPRARGWVAVAIAPQALDLAAQVPGTLVDVRASIGDAVETGATLARVAAPTLPADIDVARAALAQALADEAEGRLVVEAARRTLERQERLREAAASAAVTVDDARLAYERARTTAERLRAVSQGRRAELARLERQRDAGVLEAPFEARVVTWYQPEGAVVGSGARIVRVASQRGLWVRFAVPVEDLDEVQVGAVIEALPEPEGAPVRGIVRHVAPELDLASQQMLVEAELDDERAMLPGQACRVRARDERAVGAPEEESGER